MADTYLVHSGQDANNDFRFFNKVSGVAVLSFPNAAAGIPCKSAADGLVAHAGGGQANGLLLTAQINRVITVATAADSVVLPPSVPGLEITVINAAAANSLNIYPAGAAQGGVTGGDAINLLGVNAAFAMVVNKCVRFSCVTAGQWQSNLTA